MVGQAAPVPDSPSDSSTDSPIDPPTASKDGSAPVVDAADLLDLADPAVVADPYPSLAALRAAAPMAWHSGLGVWLATGHGVAGEVLRNRQVGRIFSPRLPEDDWDTFNWLHADSILDSEPPKHTRLRRLVAGAFGRGHVQRLGPRIEELARGLLDAADPGAGGSVDLIGQYAEPLPVLVIAELLGWPEVDRELLRPWSQAIVRMYEMDRTSEHERAAQVACREFAAYVEELAAHRVAHPGDDLLTDLVQIRDGSDRLSPHELVATAVLLLNAGHEASVNGFGNGLHSMLAAGVDPRSVPRAALAEEFLRHDSPLQLFERTATAATTIGGVELQPGDKVAAMLGAANRDPAVFSRPDTFDPTRDPNPHIAFGAGIHFCIGAPLARLELTISLDTLLDRWTGLDLVATERRPTFVLRGFESLVVSPRA